MEDKKTINKLLEEKKCLSNNISNMINDFLRDNPDVYDIEFVKQIFSHETRCGGVKEVSIELKIIM